MPNFYTEDIDISPDEFISSCSSSEIKELIDILVDEEYIKPEDIVDDDHCSPMDEEWNEIIGKLSNRGRLRLTNEEEEVIKKIADRL